MRAVLFFAHFIHCNLCSYVHRKIGNNSFQVPLNKRDSEIADDNYITEITF